MSNEYQFICLKKDYSEFLPQIVQFYAPRYKHPFTEETVTNSAIICLAVDEGEIIGAVRAISDLSRHALIVDFVVRKAYRRQKIGTKLLKLIIEELKAHNVKNISLTTEPNIEWLKDFYMKNGFEPLISSIYLELK